MSQLGQDVQVAARTLRKNIGTTILVIATLCLAIAGNAVVFGLINGLLLRPLPYRAADELVLVGEKAKDQPTTGVLPSSLANFLDWQERARQIAGLAAFRQLNLGLENGQGEPEQVAAAAVTPNFFTVLGVVPERGRAFVAEEGVAGRDRVVVLSQAFWREKLASRPDVAGSTLQLDGLEYQVLGVLPASFEFLVPTTRLFVPLPLVASQVDRHERNAVVVGRLASGANVGAARAELRAIQSDLASRYPEANRGYVLDVDRFRDAFPDQRNRVLLGLIQGAMFFVLLIACANLTNLQLARSEARAAEMAVRVSVGASRGHLWRQTLVESFLTAALAGGVAALLTLLGVRGLSKALAASVPSYALPVFDLKGLVLIAVLTLVAGAAFGLVPALQAGRGSLQRTLRAAGRSIASSRQRKLVSRLLVVAEMALSLIFLGGAGILLTSFSELQKSDPGFDTASLLTAQVQLPTSRYPSRREQEAAADELVRRLTGLPGVASVAAANVQPRSPFVPREGFAVDGQEVDATATLPRALMIAASPEFLQTLGIPLRSGRFLNSQDGPEASPVVVINEVLARLSFGGAEPLGRHLTVAGVSREVVGVVPDVRHALALSSEHPPTVYLPLAQVPAQALTLVLRSQGEPARLVPAVREEVRRFDPHLATGEVLPLDAYVERFWVGQKAIAGLLRVFGFLALLLAGLGIYGVMAHSVARRRREIGVRIALGARRSQVLAMVMRSAAGMSLIGIGIGLVGVFLISRGLAAVLAGLAPVAFGTVLVAVAVILLATALAALVPARRAASVDPVTVLQAE